MRSKEVRGRQTDRETDKEIDRKQGDRQTIARKKDE